MSVCVSVCLCVCMCVRHAFMEERSASVIHNNRIKVAVAVERSLAGRGWASAGCLGFTKVQLIIKLSTAFI